MGSARVTLVILNWNGRDDTLACLQSLEAVKDSGLKVLVVDNGSTDSSVQAVRARQWPFTVDVIETGCNLGFAEGNNVGMRAALADGADYVMLLNNDTEVAPDMVSELLAAAEQTPAAGVVGAWICYHDRPGVLWFAGAKWSDRDLAFQWPGQGLAAADAASLPLETDYVCGAAMLFRRAALERVGLLDERFFLVYEESDWCFRARRLGYGCVMAPRARLWHKIGASFGSELSPLRAYFSTRNQLLFAANHLDGAARRRLMRRSLLRLVPRFNLGDSGAPLWKRLRWGCAELVADLRRRWADPVQRAARRGIWDFVRSRFGDCPPLIRDLNRAWKP